MSPLSPIVVNTQARYAVYFAPAQESLLWRLGCTWLGRDARTGVALEAPAIAGLSAQRVRTLTASPRHYGLHATLKPPFRLAAGMSEQTALAALSALAQACTAFSLPPLEVSLLSDFIALTTTASCAELDHLAQRCVAELDFLRAAPCASELARRRAQGLSAAQELLLQRYGYPYVMDEWRFHVTLTERIFNGERAAALSGLRRYLAPALQTPVRCEDLCLFVQDSAAASFRLAHRIALSAS